MQVPELLYMTDENEFALNIEFHAALFFLIHAIYSFPSASIILWPPLQLYILVAIHRLLLSYPWALGPLLALCKGWSELSPIFQALHTVTRICASFAVGAFSQPALRLRLSMPPLAVSLFQRYTPSLSFLFLDAFQETVFRGVGGRESRFKGLNLKGGGALIP